MKAEKTKITFYSGLDSIGGVIMEVEYDNDRAFFEAGTAYNPAFDIFDGKINLRQCFIADNLWIKEIPMIPGIYRNEDIEERYPELLSAEDYHAGRQAFFISHLHLDHMRMMGMISPLVDVYLSKPAQILEKALEDLHQGVDSIRDFTYSDLKEDTWIGQIHVHRFMLNDDSYQDYSFYIETPDLKIHYTGDVFVYGKYHDSILEEIHFLQDKDIDLLVCEGTRFPVSMKDEKIEASFEPKGGLITYDQLKERMIHTVSNHKGLILFNYYEREMSDVLLFEEIARKTGRTLIFEPESAYLINRFFHKPVRILLPDTCQDKQGYLKEVSAYNAVFRKEEILQEPEKYLVQNTYPNLLELLDYRHSDTLYLHHSGMPLGDYDPKYANLMKIIDLSRIRYQKTYEGQDGYFSPHAENYQILSYIDQVHSRLVIPCHTLYRKAMIHHLKQASFYARESQTYIYNKEKNILEEYNGSDDH